MSYSLSNSPLIRDDQSDVATFIMESGIFEAEHLPHTPFLVQQEGQMILVANAQKLLDYPDETVVLGQWRGRNRSDYFRFTVGIFREYQQAGLIGKKRLTSEEVEARLIRQKEEAERKLDRLRRDKCWQQIHEMLSQGNFVCRSCGWVGTTPNLVVKETAEEITETRTCPQCLDEGGLGVYAPKGEWSIKTTPKTTKAQKKGRRRQWNPTISICFCPYENEADRDRRYRMYAESFFHVKK